MNSDRRAATAISRTAVEHFGSMIGVCVGPNRPAFPSVVIPAFFLGETLGPRQQTQKMCHPTILHFPPCDRISMDTVGIMELGGGGGIELGVRARG